MRKVSMKKMLYLLVIGTLFGAACASIPKIPIQTNELAFLKGEWEGARDIYWGLIQTFDYTHMEIFNDTLPLKGRVSIVFLDEQTPIVYSFENGTIDANGNLVAASGQEMKINLALYRERGKLKLYGSYSHGQKEGTLTLYKK
jgi:hypothetical protein